MADEWLFGGGIPPNISFGSIIKSPAEKARLCKIMSTSLIKESVIIPVKKPCAHEVIEKGEH